LRAVPSGSAVLSDGHRTFQPALIRVILSFAAPRFTRVQWGAGCITVGRVGQSLRFGNAQKLRAAQRPEPLGVETQKQEVVRPTNLPLHNGGCFVLTATTSITAIKAKSPRFQITRPHPGLEHARGDEGVHEAGHGGFGLHERLGLGGFVVPLVFFHHNASLAVSDGDLFFRTDKGLWCLANAK
jgi:hypothetical protein